jgi:hypothetical protein
MTSAQASSINDVTYGATTPKHIEAGWDQCDYKNTGTHANPVDIQDLEVDVLTIPNCWADLHQSDGAGSSVSGIGDEAFGYKIGLAIKVGSRCVQVQGLTYNELKGDYSHDVALARIVVGHLH